MRHPLPIDFVKRLQDQLHDAQFAQFEQALKKPTPISIRTNPFKPFPKEQMDIKEKVRLCENGYYLQKRPSFSTDPVFHAGGYYVQEASSMVVAQVFKHMTLPESPFMVLDLCAAPGGKSTHLRSLLPEHALLISNEVIGSRRSVLQDNLIKWGHPGYAVTQLDPEVFSQKKEVFYAAWVDAPCSGEGMFRKDPETIHQWSKEHVLHCAARQRRILQHTWPSIAPGGYLAYSTCTYAHEENEAQIQWLIQSQEAEEVFMDSLPKLGALRSSFGYRFYPHLFEGEGLYICLLQKKGTYTEINRLSKKEKQKPTAKQVPKGLDDFMEPKNYYLHVHKNFWYALPIAVAELAISLPDILPLIQLGIPVGQASEKGWIPDHGLAMLACSDMKTVAVELPWDDALHYLQKQDISQAVLHLHTEKGWQRVTYLGLSLGWIKNLGNRVNNYYPHNVRILKTLD